MFRNTEQQTHKWVNVHIVEAFCGEVLFEAWAVRDKDGIHRGLVVEKSMVPGVLGPINRIFDFVNDDLIRDASYDENVSDAAVVLVVEFVRNVGFLVDYKVFNCLKLVVDNVQVGILKYFRIR